MLTEAVLVNEAALPVTTVLMLNASIGEHPNQRTKEEEHKGKAKQRKKTTLKSGFQLPGSFILMVSSQLPQDLSKATHCSQLKPQY